LDKREESDPKLRADCERLGVKWSIISKWTSFIGVNSVNAKDHATRMYEADILELDELSTPRWPDLFPQFHAGPKLGWDWDTFDRFDSDDDEDDDDESPDSPGEGSSRSAKHSRKHCGTMQSLPARQKTRR
jgi:hypothetical protein